MTSLTSVQVDAGEPFRFLTVVSSPTVTVGELVKQVEDDFAELYGKHFKASLQVLRLQDPYHNDLPNRLRASDLLKDLDKVYVVIKNLQLPSTLPDSIDKGSSPHTPKTKQKPLRTQPTALL